MTGKISDKIRLKHILDAIDNIEKFSVGKSKDDLFNDIIYRSFIERQLEIVGEAVTRLSPELKLSHAHVPWKQVSGFRTFIVHEYFSLDLELVWDILENHIHKLKVDMEQIFEQLP